MTVSALSTDNLTQTIASITLHPDKTYIGRISKGFDYLGYHFEKQEITAHPTATQR